MLAEFGAIGALIAGYLIFRQLGMVFAWGDTVVYGLTASTVVLLPVLQISWSSTADFPLHYHDPFGHNRVGNRRCDFWSDGRTNERSRLQWPLGADLHFGHYDDSAFLVCRSHRKCSWAIGTISHIRCFSNCWSVLIKFCFRSYDDFIFATFTVWKNLLLAYHIGSGIGTVSEGGALTLNAIAGIGMLAVGILGGPVIGKMTEDSIKASIESSTDAETYQSISNDSTYFLGDYTAVDPEKVGNLPAEKIEVVKESIQTGKQGSLASVAIFPVFMLVCYIALIFYFKSKGGYKPVEI